MNHFEHVTELSAVRDKKPTFLAIGVFDGVHKGHQELLGCMSAAAGEAVARSAAMTFDPHPRSVIPNQRPPEYLSTMEERVSMLGEQGIDLIITYPFNDKTRKTSAWDFVDNLCTYLDLEQLWGGNFGLGYQRQGDLTFLRKLGEEKGYSVHQFESFLEWKDQPISSSRIRQAVRDGKMDDASALLGRSYRMSGQVIHGDGRGTELGIPTANLAVWEEQAKPKSGVYATYAWLEGRRYPAATNVGVRPTVNGRSLVVEAHLIGFEGDLYGKELVLDFVNWIRNEKKFPGLDSLVAQIRADIERVQRQLEPSSL